MMSANETLFHAWNQHQKDKEDKRLKNVQKLIDFYNNDQKEYLKDYLKLKDLDDFPFYETGLTKKIVNKISEVYKTAPLRFFGEKRSDTYESLTKKKNIAMKTIERQANLLGVVGVRPYIKDGKFDYMLLRSMSATLKGIEPTGVKFLIADNGMNRLYEYWTPENRYILDENNKKVDGKAYGFEDEKNPYGVIPFVFCQNSYIIDDFYNTGNNADDIVNANEQISLMLSEMAHKYRYTAFNPIWGKGKVDDNAIQFGYDKILWIDDPEGNVGNLSIDHKFMDDVETIKFQIQLIERNHNLSINWGISGNTSGFSLVIQNIDHQDDLLDRRGICIGWENDLLEMERIVGKKHGIVVPDKDFRVDFQELNFPLSIEEQNKKWQFELDNGLASKADYWRAQNPDMTDEQVQAKIDKIAKENKEFEEASRTEPTITELFQ